MKTSILAASVALALPFFAQIPFLGQITPPPGRGGGGTTFITTNGATLTQVTSVVQNIVIASNAQWVAASNGTWRGSLSGTGTVVVGAANATNVNSTTVRATNTTSITTTSGTLRVTGDARIDGVTSISGHAEIESAADGVLIFKDQNGSPMTTVSNGNVHATKYYGDGSALTGIVGGGGSTNAVTNSEVTVTSGTILKMTDRVTAADSGLTVDASTNLNGVQSFTTQNGITNNGSAPITSAGGFVGTGTETGALELPGITSGTQVFTVPDEVPDFTNFWSIATDAGDGVVPVLRVHGGRPVWTNEIFATVTDPLTNQFAGTQTNIGLIRAVGGVRLPSQTASRPVYIDASGDLVAASGTPDGTKFMNDAGALVTPSTASQTPVTQDIDYGGFNPTNMQQIIGKQYLAFVENGNRAFYLDNLAIRGDGELSVGNNPNVRIYKGGDGSSLYLGAQTDVVAERAVTAPNFINTVSTTAGFGGALTNVAFDLHGPKTIFIDAGTTNVNFLAAMNWLSGTARKLTAILTNRTATPRTWSLDSITNNWIAPSASTGAAALAAPQQVTNSLWVELESLGGSNIWYSVRYSANPTE